MRLCVLALLSCAPIFAASPNPAVAPPTAAFVERVENEPPEFAKTTRLARAGKIEVAVMPESHTVERQGKVVVVRSSESKKLRTNPLNSFIRMRRYKGSVEGFFVEIAGELREKDVGLLIGGSDRRVLLKAIELELRPESTIRTAIIALAKACNLDIVVSHGKSGSGHILRISL